MFSNLNSEVPCVGSEKFNNVLIIRGFKPDVAKTITDSIDWFIAHEDDVNTLKSILLFLFSSHSLCNTSLYKKILKDVERYYPVLCGKLI